MKRLLYKKELIERINCVLKEYFCQNPNAGTIPAKDFMSLFIEAGIFNKDEKNGLPIRKLLRELDDSNELSSIPFVIKQQKAINRNWFFSDSDYSPIPEFSTLQERPNTRSNKSRENSDEYYVIGLCNEVLGIEAIHQATFDFLKDDTGAGLKVDAYYEPLKLVVEYMEIQHFKKGMYGNKYCPASGMYRDNQRAMYDQRRRDILPKHGIKLVEIKYSDFAYNSKYRLLRNREEDIKVIRKLLGWI